MQWIVVGITALVLIMALPWAITAAKTSARGKGRLAGAAFAIGLAFGAMFDPAKAAATEACEKKKEIGDHEEGASGPLVD